MGATLTALLLFATWALALVAVSLLYRTGVVFARKRLANEWPRGMPPPEGEPALMVRFKDAHLNTVENLPVFAAIVAVAAAAGKLGGLDAVAMWVVYARVAQSLTHLIGTSHWLVFIRANFFTVQLALFGYMIWLLL